MPQVDERVYYAARRPRAIYLLRLEDVLMNTQTAPQHLNFDHFMHVTVDSGHTSAAYSDLHNLD
jgi:hypothetical protein